MATIPASVLILTRDEEHDLPACLASLAWCDDVHVLDSHSTDRTVAIAAAHGAAVHVRTFDGYASQRNHGLHALAHRHPWVLLLDADERVPAPLAAELATTLPGLPADVAALRLRRRDFLDGRWLRHAQMSPFYLRVVRPARVRYTREINEVLEVDGRIVALQEPFDHFPFSKGLDHWRARHARYAALEAAEVLRAGDGSLAADLRTAIAGADFHARRAAQKRLFYRLPLRPWIKWLYLVAVRQAYLDGRPGLAYAGLLADYERQIDREIAARRRRSARGTDADRRATA